MGKVANQTEALMVNGNQYPYGNNYKKIAAISQRFFMTFCALSSAKGMDIKMREDKIIKIIDELYEKYGVERIFYSDMGTEQIIRGMKGILANLDLNKQKSYTKEDAELIKDIYFMYC